MAKKANVDLPPDFYERHLQNTGCQLVAGVDEVGRGPLAGPVVAAAVILPLEFHLPGIRDSKKLRPPEREKFFFMILEEAVSFGLGIINERAIDYLNIREASFKAMEKAILNLNPPPDMILIDGFVIPDVNISQLAIAKGDNLSISIMAASIVAKVVRDHLMDIYDKIFPRYCFSQNKGYGTEGHLRIINGFGRCILHRKSFQIKGWGKERILLGNSGEERTGI